MARYQYLFMSESFWNAVYGKKVLVFQPDTLLTRHGIEQFLEYDFVGAPWTRGGLAQLANSAGGIMGNGGLSLRTVSFMKQCVRPGAFAAQRVDSRIRARQYCTNEDIVFAYCLTGEPTIKLPPRSVAEQFSVETGFYATPLGLHAIWRHLPAEQVQAIFDTIVYPDVAEEDL
jgi:hypothetical protein